MTFLKTLASVALLATGHIAFAHADITNQHTTLTNDKQTIETKLIDRQQLFGNPTYFEGRISPDGKWMSYRADVKGVSNVWIGKRGDLGSAKPITFDTHRGIPQYHWSLDSKYVFYIQDNDGDENWHMYRVDIATGETKDMTPYGEMRAQPVMQSLQHPGKVLVAMNDRDAKWHDLYMVDIATGQRTLLEQNDGFGQYWADHELNPRLALKSRKTGGYDLYAKSNDQWQPLLFVPAEDELVTAPLQFSANGKGFYMTDSRRSDTSQLSYVDIATGKTTTVIDAGEADIENVVFDPKTHKPIVYSRNLLVPTWSAVKKKYSKLATTLNSGFDGSANVLSQTNDNRFWTIYNDSSNRPADYMVFDAKKQSAEVMFNTNPKLENAPFAKMHGAEIISRDGKSLFSYLTLPVHADPDKDGKPNEKTPMVMLVHGGPWARDSFRFSPIVQWLANRGYSVLQVNYRSSTGFGKNFINAGNREWAGKMHDDLIDAKRWAVQQGVTNSDTVAIMGGSYGGYATLVGLTITPDEFACGVDIVGPSNLETLLATIPPYWESFKSVFHKAIGDPNTGEGRELLQERSPLTHVNKINKPLLIAQGANDPRVKRSESDQIVNAMKENNIPVTYALYPDEGHGFQKPENNISFTALSEQFLGDCLGGRVEPIGNDFAGSSIQIIEHGDMSKYLAESNL